MHEVEYSLTLCRSFRQLPQVFSIVLLGNQISLPNIHLCWLYGWFVCLRADRPVMAGQRARMPALVPREDFSGEDSSGTAGTQGSSPPAPAAHSAGADGPCLPEPASGASLFRKLDAVAVPTARLLPAPGSTSAISRRSPAAASAPGCRRCSAQWSRRYESTRRHPRSSSSPAIRRPAGPARPTVAPVADTSPLTRALLSVPRV